MTGNTFKKNTHTIINYNHLSIHPSSHPSSSAYPRTGCDGSLSGVPDLALPSNTFQLFLGDPKAFPHQMGCIISSPSCGSTSGSPSQLDVAGSHPRLMRSNQMPEPLYLVSLDVKEQQLYSELPPDV